MSSDDFAGYMQQSKRTLIESLKLEGLLKSPQVEEALSSVPREAFLDPETSKSLAYLDEPLPIGASGQTISAPHMVVMMLEELELRPRLKVLEVGAGSGYNAALMGYIVSRRVENAAEPLVLSIERDVQLANFARENVAKVGLSRVVTIVAGDGSLGYPQESTEELYDRITITAGAPRVPQFLKSQLKKDGVLLAPIGGRSYQQLMKLRKLAGKKGQLEFVEEKLVECMFVPLIGSDAHRA